MVDRTCMGPGDSVDMFQRPPTAGCHRLCASARFRGQRVPPELYRDPTTQTDVTRIACFNCLVPPFVALDVMLRPHRSSQLRRPSEMLDPSRWRAAAQIAHGPRDQWLATRLSPKQLPPTPLKGIIFPPPSTTTWLGARIRGRRGLPIEASFPASLPAKPKPSDEPIEQHCSSH